MNRPSLSVMSSSESSRHWGKNGTTGLDIVEICGTIGKYGLGSDKWMLLLKYTYLYSFNVKTLMFLRVLPHQYVVFYSSIRCYFEVQMQQEEAERHRQVEEHQLRVQHAQVWGLRGKSKTQDHWIRKFNEFFFFWGGGMFMKHVVCT